MTTIDSLPKFSKEDLISRSSIMARLVINHLSFKIGFGEYTLDYFSEVIEGRGEINHIRLLKLEPGMFKPGAISPGTKVLMDFAIWTKEPETVVYHGYGSWEETHNVLEELIWRFWVIEPMLLSIVTKLKKSGGSKLGIKTAEHMWNFSFLGTTDYVEIAPDTGIRKRLSARWELTSEVCHFYCAIPYKEVNTLIYGMLHQQGLL